MAVESNEDDTMNGSGEINVWIPMSSEQRHGHMSAEDLREQARRH